MATSSTLERDPPGYMPRSGGDHDLTGQTGGRSPQESDGLQPSAREGPEPKGFRPVDGGRTRWQMFVVAVRGEQAWRCMPWVGKMARLIRRRAASAVPSPIGRRHRIVRVVLHPGCNAEKELLHLFKRADQLGLQV